MSQPSYAQQLCCNDDNDEQKLIGCVCRAFHDALSFGTSFWVTNALHTIPFINYVNKRPSSVLSLARLPISFVSVGFMSEMLKRAQTLRSQKLMLNRPTDATSSFKACAVRSERKVNKCFISFIYYIRQRNWTRTAVAFDSN